MTLVYRGNGAWGTGKGANLTAAEFDGNTYELDQRIVEVEDNPAAPNEITNITQSGSQLTIHMADATTFGPFTLATSTAILAADVYAVTTTTYTPVLANANSYLRCTNASGCAVTIPLNDDVAYPVKTELHFRQAAAGQVTIEGDTGVTLNSITGYNDATAAEGGVLTVKKVATDEWDLFGFLEPS